LQLDQPRIMGVINVTPDSFSDGGELLDPERAIERGLQMLEQGADILDVGGESTRPGAEPVAVDDELRRVVPVIAALAQRGARLSIDTRRPEVMAAAVDAGALIINDITALTDPQSLPIAVRSKASVVLMHMQGDPHTMQVAPHYRDAAAEVFAFLADRVAVCLAAGIRCDHIAIDPGIGFGKTIEHNVRILSELTRYREIGCAVLVGVSRKSFIAGLSRGEPPRQRLAGSLSAALAAVARGADIVRVHDVAEMRQALNVWQALAVASDASAKR
jgi:dihydropteroate synthase